MSHSTQTRVQLDGILLKELMNKGNEFEFSIEAPSLTEEDPEDFNVETAFDYEKYADHINLDSLEIEDINSSSPDDLSAKMSNVTPDGEVKKLVKRAGIGGKVPDKSLVYVHYSFYLELEEVPFDSSYLRSSRNPFKFRLGDGSVFPGFEIAVASMVEKEKSQFLIRPKYAFRGMGVPPRIPPNATILAEIDLIKVVKCGETFDDLSEAGDSENFKKFPAAFKKAKSWQLNGNNYFQSKDYNNAIECYKKAVNLLTNCSMASDEEEENQKHLLLKVLVNQCICYNKINIPQKVCIAARDATCFHPVGANASAKLHFNWGKALVSLSEWNRAGDHFRKALLLSPDNSEISAALAKLEEKRKQQDLSEKIFFKKAFGLDDNTANETNLTVETDCLSSQRYQSIVDEVTDFAKSQRGRLELPYGLTKDEDEIAQKTALSLGLNYDQTQRAITK